MLGGASRASPPIFDRNSLYCSWHNNKPNASSKKDEDSCVLYPSSGLTSPNRNNSHITPRGGLAKIFPLSFGVMSPMMTQRVLRSKNVNPDRKFQLRLEIFNPDRNFNLDRKFQARSFHLQGPRSVQRRARPKISIHDRSLETFNPEGRDRIFSIPGPSGDANISKARPPVLNYYVINSEKITAM